MEKKEDSGAQSDKPAPLSDQETPRFSASTGEATAVHSEDSSFYLKSDGSSDDAHLDLSFDFSKSVHSPVARLMARTGYSIVQQNGQRRYGPPPDWKGSPPKRGCEVFVGKIPRDCFEDELVPVFEKAGSIYEMRLMMDYNGQNRGYAFVVYCNAADAKDSVRIVNNLEIRQGRTLGVCMSVDNCRLFIGGIPKRVSKGDIREEMEKVTEGVVDVIVYPSASDKTKNRGFAFVEYESHRAAAMARRKFLNGRVQLWNHQIAIDWAEPELEVDEDIMAQVKVLYVRNLMLTTTEQLINDTFSQYSPVERVKKIRDYAFVHFQSRDGALKALEAFNGKTFDGAIIEVTLAKPVDKETYSKTSPIRTQRQGAVTGATTAIPTTFGFLPVEYSLLPALYPTTAAPGYLPSPGKYLPRNSMGAKVIHSPRNTKGKPRTYYPVTFSPHMTVFPSTSPTGTYLQAAAAGPTQYLTDSPKRPSEEGYYDIVQNIDLSPIPSSGQAPPTQLTPPTNIKSLRSPLQILEELCTKTNNWGTPLYSLYSMTQAADGQQLFQYKVFIPGLGTIHIPSKYSRSVEEAQFTAAEFSLIQLGYPLEAAGYSPSRGIPTATALAETTPIQAHYSPHNYYIQTSPKQHSGPLPPWSPEAATAPLYTGFDGTFHAPPTQYPPPEVYHRSY